MTVEPAFAGVKIDDRIAGNMIGTLPEIEDHVRSIGLCGSIDAGQQVVPGIADRPIPIGGLAGVNIKCFLCKRSLAEEEEQR